MCVCVCVRVCVIYSHNKYAYIHIYMFMQDTYWRKKLIWRSNKRCRKTPLTKYLPLTLLQGFERGYSKFVCERVLETEHNWNILTPKVWLAMLCLSRSPLDPNSIRAPYHISSQTCTRTQLSATQLNSTLFNSPALYYLQTPTRRYGHASTPPQFLPISGDRDVSLPLSLE